MHFWQKPVCWHGINLTLALISKHNVHESSATLNLRSSSKNKCRGRTIYKKEQRLKFVDIT